MTACEWTIYNYALLCIGAFALVCIWGQRRAHNRRMHDLKTRFFKADL